LHRAGLDFRLVEAENRVGGRAFTEYDFVRGRPLELGALMVHGRRVATHTWLRELSVEIRPFRPTQNSRLALNRRIARPFRVWGTGHPEFGPRTIYRALRTYPRKMHEYRGPDLSVAAFLDHVGARPAERLIFNLLHAHTYAADPDQVGILGPVEEDTAGGEPYGFRNFQVLRGYSELFRRRAAPFLPRIDFGTRVREIRYGSSPVEIVADGPDGTTTYRSRRAVVTLPLGVLRSGGVRFDPPLPPEKERAITSLGFGAAIVVHLKLEGSDLLAELGNFTLIWGDTDSTFLRYWRDPAAPMVLTAFTTGREAIRRAALSDDEIVAKTKDELAGILPPGLRIGDAVSARIRRWAREPSLLGAYSYLPPGVPLAARRDLARPVGDRLFFAGEATHARGESATIHGAIETGYRAADEILASTGAEGRVGGPGS
jgi:monoamine oxidase